MRRPSPPVRQDRSLRLRALFGVAATAAFLTGVPSSAIAQFNGDPFSPYANAYSSSSYPNYTNIGPLGSGGMRYARPPGLGYTPGFDFGAQSPYINRIDNQLNSSGMGNFAAQPGSIGLEAPGLGGRNNSPATISGYDRRYEPNKRSNAAFLKGQQEREKLYFDAMNAKDADTRNDLLRKYRSASSRASADQRRSRVSRPSNGAPDPGTAPDLGSRTSGARDTQPTEVLTPLLWSQRLEHLVAHDLDEASKAPAP